jgi:hypothetical protein
LITFFKPQKLGNGSLVNFSLAAGQSNNSDKEFKEGCVYCKVIKQTSWNDAKHTGGFKGGKSMNVKLNMIELGKMIATMEKEIPFSGYHSGYDQNVQMSFTPWKDKGTGDQRGYGLIFTITKGGEKEKFAVGFQFGEDVVLKQFFKLAIEHIMLANYAEEKRRIKKSFAAKSVDSKSEEKASELEDEIDNIFR